MIGVAILAVAALVVIRSGKRDELPGNADHTTANKVLQKDDSPVRRQPTERESKVGRATAKKEPSATPPRDSGTRPEVPSTVVLPTVEIELAPPPRRAPRNRPPTSTPTAWVLIERVQTRIIAARIVKPYLTNEAGDEFPAVDSMLVVWVETQNLTAGRVSLRRWLNPLTEDASLWVSGERVPAAKVPSGTRILDQLVGEHKLSPGGPTAVDVLAFQSPKSDKALFLQLLGSHVGESGTYKHHIPLEMWKVP